MGIFRTVCVILGMGELHIEFHHTHTKLKRICREAGEAARTSQRAWKARWSGRSGKIPRIFN